MRPAGAASYSAGTRSRTALPDRTAAAADSTSGQARPSGCHRTCRRRSSRTFDFWSGKTRRRHHRRSRLNYLSRQTTTVHQPIATTKNALLAPERTVFIVSTEAHTVRAVAAIFFRTSRRSLDALPPRSYVIL
ncbi:unnamed protein product [Macrosiphum euphorbiae]|uniref:Uncharacterized protein n=1 Tax=Macrosiphum euphorbiae TaxID=13131 RepID=A0AAV0WE02_9HEMI|nr:unnamed protein product [Macrosiphum euphorbiae]